MSEFLDVDFRGTESLYTWVCGSGEGGRRTKKASAPNLNLLLAVIMIRLYNVFVSCIVVISMRPSKVILALS